MIRDKSLLYLNFFGGRLWESINVQAMSELQSRGFRISYWNIGKFRFPRTNVRGIPGFIEIKQPSKVPYVEVKYDLDSLLASEAQSFFKWQEPRGFVYSIYKHQYQRRMNQFGRQFAQVLESQNFDLVVIPNGRTAITALARQICELLGVEVRFLETNSGFAVRNSRFFLESFTPHDRYERQKSIATEETDERRDFLLFREWFSRRANSSVLFEESFLVDYSRAPCPVYKTDYEVMIPQRWNVFFTSSSDEYWNLGPEWELDDWSSQYEAFNHVISTLKDSGERNFILRIHPGLADKNHKHVKAEITKIKELALNHPEIYIVGPMNKLSAYELIAASRRVIVAASTVGLEASGLGRPVWCTKPTFYDELADIKKIWAESEASTDNLQLYSVDPSKAWRFFGGVYDTGIVSRKDTPRGHGSQRLESVLNIDLFFRLASIANRKKSASKSRKLLSVLENEEPPISGH